MPSPNCEKNGRFVFMDTYVFVLSTDGTEVVTPLFPTLEGKNLMDLKDVSGKAVAREEIAAAVQHGRAWVDCFWYKPGNNTPARKQTSVRKVQSRSGTFVVGSGLFAEAESPAIEHSSRQRLPR